MNARRAVCLLSGGIDSATAAAIAKNGLVAVTHAKDSIANGLDMAKEDGLRYEASMFAVLFATEDQSEGMGAFVAKRKASFKGQ